MNTRRISLVALSFVLGLILLPRGAAAQEDGYPFSFSHFSLDVFGARSKIQSEDFNAMASYRDSYIRFFYDERYAYLYGPAATTTRTGEPVFRPLDVGRSWGGRLLYRMSPTLTLSLGLQRLRSSENTRVDVFSEVPGVIWDKFQATEFGLSASALIPTLGVNLGWDTGRIFRIEIFIAGGPFLTEIHTTSDETQSLGTPLGVLSSTRTRLDMKGKGIGVNGELGTRLRIRALKFAGLFLEGGYAFRHAGQMSGPGSKTVETDLSYGPSTATTETWDRDWTSRFFDGRYDWGRLLSMTSGNDFVSLPGFTHSPDGWAVSPFCFDMSGFEIKIGVSIGI